MRPCELILSGGGTILATITGSAAWKSIMAQTTDATGLPWFKEILGPLGALSLAIVVIYVLVKDYAEQRRLRDIERSEANKLLLSLVRDAAANSARLTDALEENSRVIKENSKTIETVNNAITRCHDSKTISR
jgi:hypothetical protein